ncbi:MAG: PAS domain S-box protein [Euryarchaeota archaeon]|nr:PAS domain S-box protein [Euryarchaeota archaeon]
MVNQSNSKNTLLNELSKLRQRVSKLEKSENRLKEREKTLKETEKRFRLVTDNMLDIISICDLEAVITYVSPSVKNVLGYDPEYMLDKPIFDFMHPDDLEIVKTSFQEHLADFSPGKANYRLKHADGHYVWLETLGNPLLNNKRHIIGGVFLNRDITKRKNAEEMLQQSEARLQYLMSSNPAVIFSFEMRDTEITITYISENIKEHLGYEPAELMDITFWRSCVHPDDLEKLMTEASSRLLEEGRSVDEYRFKGKDERYMWLHDEKKVVSRDQDGTIKVVGSWFNITDRKKIEKALENSKKKYRAIFETSPDYIVLLGVDGRIMDANLAVEKISGLSREELVGMYFLELGLISEEDIPMHLENVSRLLKGEQIEPSEVDFVDKDGKQHWAQVYTTVLREDGDIAILVVSGDVTELKKAENEMKAALEEKEMLMKEIHHRVKNNLMVISSLLSLQSQYIQDKEVLDIFKESQNRAKSMALIHERLYRSDDLKRINFGEYIRTLTTDLFHTYVVDPSLIKLNMNVEDVILDI